MSVKQFIYRYIARPLAHFWFQITMLRCMVYREPLLRLWNHVGHWATVTKGWNNWLTTLSLTYYTRWVVYNHYSTGLATIRHAAFIYPRNLLPLDECRKKAATKAANLSMMLAANKRNGDEVTDIITSMEFRLAVVYQLLAQEAEWRMRRPSMETIKSNALMELEGLGIRAMDQGVNRCDCEDCQRQRALEEKYLGVKRAEPVSAEQFAEIMKTIMERKKEDADNKEATEGSVGVDA